VSSSDLMKGREKKFLNFNDTPRAIIDNNAIAMLKCSGWPHIPAEHSRFCKLILSNIVFIFLTELHKIQ